MALRTRGAPGGRALPHASSSAHLKTRHGHRPAQLPKLHQPGFAQAEEVGVGIVLTVANDNVVENTNPHHLARPNELLGNLDIFG